MGNPIIQTKSWNIILPVEKPEIPARVREEAATHGLKEKEEHHISILVSVNAKRVRDAIERTGNVQTSGEEIKNLTRSFSWNYDLKNEYYLHENYYTEEELRKNIYADLTEHTRRTIVQCVSLPDMDTFYKKLENFLDISLPRPVPHITLFRWSDYGDYPGISINSKDEFNRYTVKKI